MLKLVDYDPSGYQYILESHFGTGSDVELANRMKAHGKSENRC
jgi:hypothetical protein